MNTSSPFYSNGGVSDSIDEFHLQDHIPFLNDGTSKNSVLFYSQSELSSSPGGGGSVGNGNGVDPSFFPYGYGGSVHR